MDKPAEALTKHYRSLTDDELQHIASTSELTQAAKQALGEELARRNLSEADVAHYKAEQELDELAMKDAVQQKLLRRKKRMKFYAYSYVVLGIAIFALGLIKFATGEKNVGIGVMLSVVIALPAAEMWLWLRWQFYKFALRP